MAPHIDDRSRFVRTRIAASGPGAAKTRTEFGCWLGRHFTLGAEQVSDLLLAVNEALANAAEFAYLSTPQHGTMDVSANYDVDKDTLAVTVNDRGCWHHSVSSPATSDHAFRGRGIPLMRALADEATINSTPHGTHVTLTWNALTRSASSEKCRS
jgi:anti-sigma regulatory factor (Ser/Thr protein kinase)